MNAAMNNEHVPAWSRRVLPCPDLFTFVLAFRRGVFDDPEDEPPTTAEDFAGMDGNPLLVAPGERRESTLISGEIRDGVGYHPAVTFRDCTSGSDRDV